MDHTLNGARRDAIGRSSLIRYRDWIDDWDAFTAALARPLAPCIWANPSRIQVADLQKLLTAEGLASHPVSGLPEALRLDPGVRSGQYWWFCAGLAHTQEIVSQLPVRCLDPRPGQRVLDLCAAPGGKTAQIAFALGNRGTLIANDIATARLKALQGNLDRLGVVNVSTTRQDGTSWPRAGGRFDRILVDAPCSAEGTLRRTPGLLQRLQQPLAMDPEARAALVKRQCALLRRALQCCRPGGRVVYSTCTLAPEENEGVVATLLAEFGARVTLRQVTLPGFVTAPGFTRWQGETWGPELARCARIWPHHNDTGGFFIAVLDKSHAAVREWGDETSPGSPPVTHEPGAEGAAMRHDLGERFGIAPRFWDELRWRRQTRRGLHLVAADHCPPARPRVEGSGLFFYRTSARPPKPTTAGALLFGPQAALRHLDLDAAQRDAYLARESALATAAQRAACPPGQVLARFGGWVLGIALLHPSGQIDSLFPRGWSGCTAAVRIAPP